MSKKSSQEESIRCRLSNSKCSTNVQQEIREHEFSPRDENEFHRLILVPNNGDTPIVIDSDSEEDFTSTEVSDDEEDQENNYQTENILQSIHRSNQRNHLYTQTINIVGSQSDGILQTTQMNNDQLLAQTMAILAAKHPHVKPVHSTPTDHEILSFVGPCPLYSLESSFGLDMHHGLLYFPCRDVLADGGGHLPATSLWFHLTVYHNLNLPSSSLIISHLLLSGYALPSPILFPKTQSDNLLRTTPRYHLMKRCPLTKYGVYGIDYSHGARLCSGFTYNTNIYVHLISFHNMTDDAARRLSRAIGFHDRQFQFQANEIIVNDHVNIPLVKKCQIKRKQTRNRLFEKILRIRPVRKISEE